MHSPSSSIALNDEQLGLLTAMVDSAGLAAGLLMPTRYDGGLRLTEILVSNPYSPRYFHC